MASPILLPKSEKRFCHWNCTESGAVLRPMASMGRAIRVNRVWSSLVPRFTPNPKGSESGQVMGLTKKTGCAPASLTPSHLYLRGLAAS